MEFNFENEIKCVCGEIFIIKDFKKHFKDCQKFKNEFHDFDNNISNLIKSYSQPKGNLLLIRFIFKEYINILNKQIKGNFVEISRSFRDSFMNSLRKDEDSLINDINISCQVKKDGLNNSHNSIKKHKPSDYDKNFTNDDDENNKSNGN